MFTTGAKLQVTASSTSKSSKPRTGSEGYYVGATNIRYHKELSSLVLDAGIVFTRYGKEENEDRLEYKEIMSLIPVVFNKKEQKSRLEGTASRLGKGMTKRDSWKSRIFCNGMKPGTPVIMLSPSNPVSLLNTPGNQFLGWLISILKAELRTSLLRHKLASKMLLKSKVVDNITLMRVVDMAYNPDKMAKLSARRNNPEKQYVLQNKEEILETLTKVMAIHSRHFMKPYVESYKRLAENYSGVLYNKEQTAKLLRHLVAAMFIDPAYDFLSDTMFAKELDYEKNHGAIHKGKEPKIHEVLDATNCTKEYLINMKN